MSAIKEFAEEVEELLIHLDDRIYLGMDKLKDSEINDIHKEMKVVWDKIRKIQKY